MYQVRGQSWLKHGDFVLWDCLCMQLAFLVAYLLKFGIEFPYSDYGYRSLIAVMALEQICFSFFLKNYKNILRRGFWVELQKTVIYVSIVVGGLLLYFFVLKISEVYSRSVIIWLWVIGIVLVMMERMFWKKYIRKRLKNKGHLNRMVLISTVSHVREALAWLEKIDLKDFSITDVILTDRESAGLKEIQGIPLWYGYEKGLEILREKVVDEVFLDSSCDMQFMNEYLEACMEMGIAFHYQLDGRYGASHNTIVEEFGNQMVLTTSLKLAEGGQVFLKRLLDIAGGLVGLILTAILTVILGPIIYLQSPGPIFFAQERIGKNGRHFRLYKFRSMYLDAEERKKELMAQNKMDGFMFKMDHDPRIIPIGHFIRKTSLDEFPQFYNVLKGDMSLVGTRPPTVDEFVQYEDHHRARLSIKPGLTGMWQVSGRSDIVNFEEVVALDKKYIEEWSLWLDIKILFQTVKVVLTGKGSV